MIVVLNRCLFNPVQLDRWVEQAIERAHSVSVAGAKGNVSVACAAGWSRMPVKDIDIMNAFEQIVSQYLEEEGYWVRKSVKVNISKSDKVAIGLPSMPRPEVDIVALSVKQNELLLLEVKSYLDSYGVYFEAVSDRKDPAAKRFRLFTDDTYRKIVTRQLRQEYLSQGLVTPNTVVAYGLACANIHSGSEPKIASYFKSKGWQLFTPAQIKAKIKQLSDKGWEDDLVVTTAKLILRK